MTLLARLGFSIDFENASKNAMVLIFKLIFTKVNYLETLRVETTEI